MYDFAQSELRKILALKPSAGVSEAHSQGFAEAQREIYRILKGDPVELPEVAKSQVAAAAPTLTPKPAAGMEVREIRTQRVLRISLATHSEVRVGYPEGWVREFASDTFWHYFDLVDGSGALLPSSLELAGELTQIDGLIRELGQGYSDAGAHPFALEDSALYEVLRKRRSELRQRLVALG